MMIIIDMKLKWNWNNNWNNPFSSVLFQCHVTCATSQDTKTKV